MNSILVDTSAWILFYKDSSHLISETIRDLIIADEVVYNGLVLAELLQGCRNKKEFKLIQASLEILHFENLESATWELSGKVGYTLRRKGFAIPLTDCAIAAQCILKPYPLFTLDKHFSFIANFFPLQLFTP